MNDALLRRFYQSDDATMEKRGVQNGNEQGREEQQGGRYCSTSTIMSYGVAFPFGLQGFVRTVARLTNDTIGLI